MSGAKSPRLTVSLSLTQCPDLPDGMALDRQVNTIHVLHPDGTLTTLWENEDSDGAILSDAALHA